MAHSYASKSRPRPGRVGDASPRLRQARAQDIDRLVSIHTNAYPDARGHDARVSHLCNHPLGALDDLWVLEERGVLVAHGFLFALEAWFGGERVRMGGVATVGVAPEARGRGVGSRLVAHLHEVADARGDAVTVLHPFRQGFYARLGYAAASPYVRLRLDPRAIPWRAELRVRPASGADRDALASCWEGAGVRRTGTLVRSKRAWEARLLDERRTWLVVEGRSGVEGYIAWTVAQDETLALSTLTIDEMAAGSGAATRSLWGAVAAQRDHVSEVRVAAATDDPIDRALIDASGARLGDTHVERLLGELVAGPMVRVVDVPRALAARGWGESGLLVLDIDGERLELSIRDGRAAVAPTNAAAHIHLGRTTLSAVAFGALRASHAARLGWLRARDERSMALADALLELPSYFSPNAF
jgi:predicted acetyltransferase